MTRTTVYTEILIPSFLIDLACHQVFLQRLIVINERLVVPVEPDGRPLARGHRHGRVRQPEEGGMKGVTVGVRHGAAGVRVEGHGDAQPVGS